MLGDSLISPTFLSRLDDMVNPQMSTGNLRQVFIALEMNPTPTSERVCLQALASADFTANPSRPAFALAALAAVRPLSAAAESAFVRTNALGHFQSNGPLLAANGSPRSIALLESQLADRGHALEDRIDLARQSLVPYRTRLALVEMVDRLSRRPDMEPDLIAALAECLYDYRPEAWYGKRRRPPAAPDWKGASPEAKRAARDLGKRLLAIPPKIDAALQKAIRTTLASLD
jgi:hypothetical protein